MINYIQMLKPEIQEYFKILSPEGIPEFIRINKISKKANQDIENVKNFKTKNMLT